MISIECNMGLPIKYESFLVEKYNSFLTTCRYIEVYYPSCDINYMLVYENESLIELLVFGNEGKSSRCFNSLAEIDQNIVTKCVEKLFEKFPSIQKVKIDASYKSYDFKKSFLCNNANDHIIELPLTIDDYLFQFGNHAKKIRYYKSKLSRDHPDIKFVVKCGSEINENIVNKIVQLNIDRMKSKGIVSGKDDIDKLYIHKYSQYYGLACFIELDNEIIAGSISYILKNRVYGIVISHDNNFNKYSIGQMCIIYTIQISIEKGMRKFHFLWGENEYKARLLAKPQPIFSYFVYKNYSFDYIFSYTKAQIIIIINKIRISKYSKHFRDAIKSYRKKFYNL